jgi:putative ABC transport system permease protein
MKNVALRGMTGRKLRTILTMLSIVLGTAMISGTFILRDQITGAYGSLISDSNKGTDVLLKKKTAFTTEEATAGPIPESLVQKVSAVPGVASAEGQIEASASVVVDGRFDDATSAGIASAVSAPFGQVFDYATGAAPSRLARSR